MPIVRGPCGPFIIWAELHGAQLYGLIYAGPLFSWVDLREALFQLTEIAGPLISWADFRGAPAGPCGPLFS